MLSLSWNACESKRRLIEGRFDIGSHVLLMTGASGVPIEEFGKSYTITVEVRDSSSPKLKGGRTYTVEVTYPDDPLWIAGSMWPAVLDQYYSQRVYVLIFC